MGKVGQYVTDARAELKKVQWPTKTETRNHTILVIIITLLTAAFLGALDFILNIGLGKLIS